MSSRILLVIFFLYSIASASNSHRSPIILEHPTSVIVPKNEPLTLNCKADGVPEPKITWYKDGNKLMASGYESSSESHRVLLPSGSLFFLRVIQNKKEQDGGTYWCEASNSLGTAISSNASLEVSVLRDDFRLMPVDTIALEGNNTVLQCWPPKGNPKPTVRWKKNNQFIEESQQSRFSISESGNLIIQNVIKSDEGSYVCSARNMVGSRESEAANLSVWVKPYFLVKPDDVTVFLGEDVSLTCSVGGNPKPTVEWSRENEYTFDESRTSNHGGKLTLRSLRSSDEGLYICSSFNEAGNLSASSSLFVHERPNFILKPKDQRIGMNGVAKFECLARGNPPPSVFWTKEGSQELMFAGTTHGQMSVSSSGTLVIQGVRKEDDGFYICSALSVAGSQVTEAYLEVTAIEEIPPPIIALGPSNQTLPLHTKALLLCQAFGMPTPVISWLKNQGVLSGKNSRVTIQKSGNLIIENLMESDTGLYTCIARSESGETSWSASLTVADPKNPHIIFNKGPEVSALPSPPSKPQILDRRFTSITISWRSSNSESILNGYTVEYFSSDLQTGWVVAAHRITSETYTIRNLKPDASYVFLVRSENSHGLSAPSAVSERVRTWRLPQSGSQDISSEEVSQALLSKVLTLTSLQALSSTTIRVLWNIHSESLQYVEGFFIRYRELSGGSSKFNIKTIMRERNSQDHVISNLRKYTEYEVFLTPFYKRIEGQPSNSLHVQTLEDVPSSAPSSLSIYILTDSSARLSWSPPSPQHRNGELLGYQIQISEFNDSLSSSSVRLHSNVSTTASSTTLNLVNLTLFKKYEVLASAFTRIGLGPFSSPFYFLMMSPNETPLSISDKVDENVLEEPWFIVLLIIVLIALLSFFGGGLFLQRRSRSKDQKSSSYTSTSTVRSQYGKASEESVWIHGDWKNTGPYLRVSSEDLYAEVSESHLVARGIVSNTPYGLRRANELSPYATTVVLPSQKTGGMHTTKTVSTNISTSLENEGESSYLLSHLSRSSPIGSSTKISGGIYIPNWSEILPPPPPLEHRLPSSEISSSSSSPPSLSRNNYAGRRHHFVKAKSLTKSRSSTNSNGSNKCSPLSNSSPRPEVLCMDIYENPSEYYSSIGEIDDDASSHNLTTSFKISNCKLSSSSSSTTSSNSISKAPPKFNTNGQKRISPLDS